MVVCMLNRKERLIKKIHDFFFNMTRFHGKIKLTLYFSFLGHTYYW